MITRDDLDWWYETAARLQWIWAKTYAETAPHHYVVEGRTADINRDDFVRAGRVIHTFGRPAKFYGMMNLYLRQPGRPPQVVDDGCRPRRHHPHQPGDDRSDLRRAECAEHRVRRRVAVRRRRR